MGVPNLTKLFIHSAMVLFSVFVLQLLAFWQYPAPQARRRARAYLMLGLLVLTVMSVLILVAPVHDRYTIHFWKTHAGQTVMLWYLTIFLVALSVSLLAIAHRAWRFAALTGHIRWLRLGLRITTVGALVSLGYCLCRGGYLLLLGAGIQADALVDIAIPFASLGQVIFFTGLTMPSWGALTRVDQVGTYRALEPLWTALHEAFPDIALHSPPNGGAAVVGDLNYRLYRRMVEIWDGLLALHPYLPAGGTTEPADRGRTPARTMPAAHRRTSWNGSSPWAVPSPRSPGRENLTEPESTPARPRVSSGPAAASTPARRRARPVCGRYGRNSVSPRRSARSCWSRGHPPARTTPAQQAAITLSGDELAGHTFATPEQARTMLPEAQWPLMAELLQARTSGTTRYVELAQ